ncbi:hypothetical protein [Acidaminococcus sp.]|uniref:hypothetical protein n=1 Tax=Acidaminococcus sp. TaxID=1872103 RepID=UPI003D7EBFF2
MEMDWSCRRPVGPLPENRPPAVEPAQVSVEFQVGMAALARFQLARIRDGLPESLRQRIRSRLDRSGRCQAQETEKGK